MKHQQRIALQSAQRVRLARARLRKEICTLPESEGRAMLGDVLIDPPDFILTARIFDVLQWPTRMGSYRAQRIMRASMIGDRLIGQTSPRQRQNLARCLRGLEKLVSEEEHDRLAQLGREYAA